MAIFASISEIATPFTVTNAFCRSAAAVGGDAFSGGALLAASAAQGMAAIDAVRAANISNLNFFSCKSGLIFRLNAPCLPLGCDLPATDSSGSSFRSGGNLN
jgi:hypothetical protein